MISFLNVDRNELKLLPFKVAARAGAITRNAMQMVDLPAVVTVGRFFPFAMVLRDMAEQTFFIVRERMLRAPKLIVARFGVVFVQVALLLKEPGEIDVYSNEFRPILTPQKEVEGGIAWHRSDGPHTNRLVGKIVPLPVIPVVDGVVKMIGVFTPPNNDND